MVQLLNVQPIFLLRKEKQLNEVPEILRVFAPDYIEPLLYLCKVDQLLRFIVKGSSVGERCGFQSHEPQRINVVLRKVDAWRKLLNHQALIGQWVEVEIIASQLCDDLLVGAERLLQFQPVAQLDLPFVRKEDVERPYVSIYNPL